MTRAITLSYEDAVLIAEVLVDYVGDYLWPSCPSPVASAAMSRFADALDEAEARKPNGLFPRPTIIGPRGEVHEI